jgi:hypothetical protein
LGPKLRVMLKLEDAVNAAETLVKLDAGIIRVRVNRLSSGYKDEPRAEVEYFVPGKVGTDYRTFEKGDSDEKIATDSIDYLASKLTERGVNVGVIPPQEVRTLKADRLSEISQKYDLTPAVKSKLQNFVYERLIPRSDNAAILYRKKAPAPVMGQMKLI